MVIVISGSVGTGKTTLAKALAEQIDYTYIDVNKIIKLKNLSEGYDRKRKSKIVDTKKLNKILIDIIKDYKGIIIDSHMSHFLPKKYVDTCIITKCNLKKLEKRLKGRGYPKSKIKDNLEAEIFDVCYEEANELGHKIMVVDTSERSNLKEMVKKLKPKKFKQKQIKITSTPISIRTLEEKDAEILAYHANHSSVCEFTTVPKNCGKKEMLKFIRQSSQNRTQGSGYSFCIDLKGKPIGMMGLFEVKKGSAEIGYWIGKDYRRKGYSRKAAELIIKYAFKTLNLKQLTAKVNSKNKASIEFLNSLGFKTTTINNKKHTHYFKLDKKDWKR